MARLSTTVLDFTVSSTFLLVVLNISGFSLAFSLRLRKPLYFFGEYITHLPQHLIDGTPVDLEHQL